MIFVGVTERLAERPWNKDVPSYHISPLEEEEKPVRTKFSNPYVYQVGTHRGCSCDLLKYSNSTNEFDDDRRQFYKLVNDHLNKGERVEIYCCWAGDYDATSEETTLVTTTEIGDDFYIDERELIVYVSS
jgi:hypothetical protein